MAINLPPPQAEGLLSLIQSGGVVILLLICLSLVVLSVFFSKLILFYRMGLQQHQIATTALQAWQNKQPKQAVTALSSCKHPAAITLLRIINAKQKQLNDDTIQAAAIADASDALFTLRRGFKLLELIGNIAPLLGLLGTVFGMIQAFQQLEQAGSQVNPALLSGGIWEALLTTAAGLCVAIPTVSILNWLERRVEHVAHQLEYTITQAFIPTLTID